MPQAQQITGPCLWVQYEPAGSTTPFPGFIDGTVTGVSTSPPNNAPRLNLAVALGTSTNGMMVDVVNLVLEDAPPSNPTTINTSDFILRLTPQELSLIRASQDPTVQQFMVATEVGGSVDLTSQALATSIAYLVAHNLLTQDRATSILTP